MPHDIAADPRVTQTDFRVLAALLYYARDQLVCRPCDASIGLRVGRSSGTIQRSLRRLEAIGYIARQAVQPSDENRTGRLIHLLWCEPDWPRPVPDPPSASARPPKRQRATPQAPARDKEKEEEKERNVTNVPPPEGNAPPPRRPQEPPPATLTASRPPQHTRPLSDELKALPGAEPSMVRSLAWRLAHHLQDVASIGFFIMVLGLVATGLAPVERLLAAFVVADRSRGKARKPGAIFAAAWSGWEPAPKPSEINRPTYHRAPAPVPRPEPPPPGPRPRETIVAEMLSDWETWASQPRHPLAGYARKMLAAHEAGELPPEGGGELSVPQDGPVVTQVVPVAAPVVDRTERDRARATPAYWEGLTPEERERIDAEALAQADPAARADYEAETDRVKRRLKMSAIRNAYLESATVAG